jgi:hypothetical protein
MVYPENKSKYVPISAPKYVVPDVVPIGMQKASGEENVVSVPVVGKTIKVTNRMMKKAEKKTQPYVAEYVNIMPIEEQMQDSASLRTLSEKTPSIPSERSSERGRRIEGLVTEQRQAEDYLLAKHKAYKNGLTNAELENYARVLGVDYATAEKTLNKRLSERKIVKDAPLELRRENALDILRRAETKAFKQSAGKKNV